jgi:hypothetical protein
VEIEELSRCTKKLTDSDYLSTAHQAQMEKNLSSAGILASFCVSLSDILRPWNRSKAKWEVTGPKMMPCRR